MPSTNSDALTSGGVGELIISPKAYLKVVMHALRYPHSIVNGLLIVEKKSKSGGDGDKSSRIVDAIPLFHSGHGLAPMVEIALAQVSEYFAKNSDFTVGGYYQANEYFHEFPNPTPTVFAERIADKILEANPEAVLLMVSNYDLANAVDDISKLDSPFYMFQNTDGKWKLKNGSTNSKNFSLESDSLIYELLHDFVFKKQYHSNIIDFDSHLENIKNDWRNPKLNEAIEQFVKSN